MAEMDITGTSDPFANIRNLGVDQPTIATPEQNDRVRRIMEALSQGQRPSDVGIPYASDLGTTPPPAGSTSTDPLESPLDKAMKRDPQGTVKALQAAYGSLKGIPQKEQDRIMSNYLDPKLETLMVQHTPGEHPASTTSVNPVHGQTEPGSFGMIPQIQPVPEPSPQDAERHAKIMEILTKRNYTKAGAEAMANSAVPSVRQWNLYQDQLKKNQEKVAQVMASPAPTNGLHLDAEGHPYNPMLNQDRTQGSVFYGNNTPQFNLVKAIPLLTSHIEETMKQVDKIAPKGHNAFANWVQAKRREFYQDPNQVALKQLLDPASAMAMSTLYASGGAAMRGGVRAAEMFGHSFYDDTNNVQAVKQKLSTALGLMQHLALSANVHPAYQRMIEQAQRDLESMGSKGSNSVTQGVQKFENLPDPKMYANQVMKDPETGARKVSNGVQWIDLPAPTGEY